MLLCDGQGYPVDGRTRRNGWREALVSEDDAPTTPETIANRIAWFCRPGILWEGRTPSDRFGIGLMHPLVVSRVAIPFRLVDYSRSHFLPTVVGSFGSRSFVLLIIVSNLQQVHPNLGIVSATDLKHLEDRVNNPFTTLLATSGCRALIMSELFAQFLQSAAWRVLSVRCPNPNLSTSKAWWGLVWVTCLSGALCWGFFKICSSCLQANSDVHFGAIVLKKKLALVDTQNSNNHAVCTFGT